MSSPNGDVRLPVDAKKKQTGISPEQGRRAVTGLIGMYIIVAGAVSISWLLGFFMFSFVWSFMLIATLFLIWKAKVSHIIKQHLSVEETELYRKRAFRQNETVEWLNFLVNRWWIFSSFTIEQLIKKRLDERLWDIRPQFLDTLELAAFSTGEQTPNIRNVQVFELTEGVPGGHKPVAWFNVNKAPVGLDKMPSYQAVIQFDVLMTSEDFRMIFRSRVGSKKVNIGFDMIVEDLQLSGKVQAIVHMSMDVPFPHISKVSICFVEKPDVMFNIRMLKAIQMMEIPLLKSWIHTNVLEGLTKAMVDPASVNLTMAKPGPIEIGHAKKKKLAQGVLTIHIKGSPPKSAVQEDIRYIVLSIRDYKRQTHEVPATEEWNDVCSFFIHSLGKDEIQIKSKCKRLLTSTTLEQTKVNLSSFPFQVKSFAETSIEHKDASKLHFKMQYTALPVINLDAAEVEKRKKVTEVAGVMYVCIHGASNVRAADKTGASDPYCVLFCNRRRLLTTPWVSNTRNPRWESAVEFFVGDFTKDTYSFFVFDWDGTSMINDDFLGVAHLSLEKDENVVVKRSLTLGYNRPEEGFIQDKSCGQITVSLIFRPVASVAKSEKFRDVIDSFKGDEYLYREDLMSPSTRFKGGARKSISASSYVNEYLEDKLIVELTILQGKDLVAMDRNGYSDPFCIVSQNGKKVYTTSVKKKTLFPKWNEMVTVDLKQEDSLLTIEVFDKDVISKDFMGKLTLSVEKLKELSIKGVADWFQLERTKSGHLQLKCNVISKDTLGRKAASPASSPTNEVSDTVFNKPSIPSMLLDNSYLAEQNKSAKAATKLEVTSPSELGSVQMRRSLSDVKVDKAGVTEAEPGINNYGTLPRSTNRRSSNTLTRPTSLSNSMTLKDRGDSLSVDEKDILNTTAETVDSAYSMSEKFFSVTGTVHRARGFNNNHDVYCKVRFEQPGSRISLFSGSRVIGKSKHVPSTNPVFDIRFEIDHGRGVSPDSTLIFDIKHSSREHIATKSFSLKEILADSEGVCKWLPLQNGVELELTLSTGQPTPSAHRRKVFKSLSFRKDKDK